MTVKIGINGLGRIGRMIIRSLIENNNKKVEIKHVCNQGEMTSRSALYQTLTLKLSSSAQKCWRYVQFRLMIGEKQTR